MPEIKRFGVVYRGQIARADSFINFFKAFVGVGGSIFFQSVLDVFGVGVGIHICKSLQNFFVGD